MVGLRPSGPASATPRWRRRRLLKLLGDGTTTETDDGRVQRLRQRMAELSRTDAQFARASPDVAVSAAIEQPDMPLIAVVQAVMEGYAQRPALGQRATRVVTGD